MKRRKTPSRTLRGTQTLKDVQWTAFRRLSLETPLVYCIIFGMTMLPTIEDRIVEIQGESL